MIRVSREVKLSKTYYVKGEWYNLGNELKSKGNLFQFMYLGQLKQSDWHFLTRVPREK